MTKCDRFECQSQEQAGLDEELVNRCSQLIHLGAFDEAIRSAFVLLEERLRKAVNVDGMTGTNLANHAFSKDSPLVKHLSRNPSEGEGLRELYSGHSNCFAIQQRTVWSGTMRRMGNPSLHW